MSKKNGKLKITLKRSIHGRKPGHAETVRGLGITRPHQSVVIDVTPCILGMVNKVSHLIQVEEV